MNSENSIKYLIKFVSEKSYAESLLDGALFMRCAAYYHELERKKGPGQGDLREGAIFPGTQIYKNAYLPMYCMYSVEDFDVFDGHTLIDRGVVEDFECTKGYLVLIDYLQFENAIKKIDTYGFHMVGGKVEYCTLSVELSSYLITQSTVRNLFIKDPFFIPQKEFRLVVCQKIPGYEKMDVKDMHRVYCIPGGIRSFAKSIYIPSLSCREKKYHLQLSVD